MTQETKQKDKRLRVTVKCHRGARNPLNITDIEIHKQRKKPEDYETVLPLYKYEHSKVAYSTTPFRSHWDSGQIGYVTSDKLIPEDVTHMIENDYTNWCNGEVYRLRLETVTNCNCCYEKRTERIDRIGGLYNDDVHDDETVKELCEECFNETPDEIKREF